MYSDHVRLRRISTLIRFFVQFCTFQGYFCYRILTYWNNMLFMYIEVFTIPLVNHFLSPPSFNDISLLYRYMKLMRSQYQMPITVTKHLKTYGSIRKLIVPKAIIKSYLFDYVADFITTARIAFLSCGVYLFIIIYCCFTNVQSRNKLDFN